ncbi:MAG TPA: NosL protein [Pseudomonas sp.]|jgi:copper chaperone NosL|uniref:nitrous oxide reductase accessory protein NosL n=1 Tax=Stutzerimonas stutzeri TaxID=316 RepID=UPI000EC7B388|nr:nitrous oxide reductase accessory protein NosL [Stutzerimonas stutzeri]MBH3353917.1 nitrous oxide reductase accessory protein NosL [Stutzerimonas stutzeri]MDH1539381.1 nitrous oxide reductase accessory protein NosL [Stutzerimonas stutzeri]RRV83503.1 NosL protein [Stutzerimonas stutzeri]HBZ98615.1 NosL protein [Pseudomonas sp.]
MNTLHRIGAGAVFALLLGLGLAGCGDQEEVRQSLEPVAFHASDECHVCGMIISDFPGPKGQAVEKGGVKKFCSTAEMLGWWLQPENRLLEARLYVHDMGRSVWEHPDDGHLIDATSAYYVVGTTLKGAMGASLASFAQEQDAQALASMHGGRVLRFDEIDQALLQEAASMQHGGMHGHLSDDAHGAHAGH